MDRFIVGTGRCGSTLLSRMLALNPETCSIFEYFNGLDVTRRFQPQPMSGDAFAELIAAEQKFVTAVLRRGYPVAEITYPFADGPVDGRVGPETRRGRYRRDEPLPWILVSLLPRLSDDPDALFEEVMEFCRARPEGPVVAHHRALFDWLTRRLGRAHWIERAGSSIDYLPALAEHFPEARFLHIHRDGCEAALSMRQHHAFRVPIAILYQAAAGEGPSIAEIDFDAAPEPSDPISRILSGEPPVAYYGRYWSDQIAHGLAARPRIAPGGYRELRFEDVVRDPARALREVADFFELTPGDWMARAEALVAGAPPARFPALSDADRDALARACEPGRALLAASREQSGSAGV
jgi:putative sulfotransferase